MTLGVRRRWYCSNVAKCDRARSDTPFWEADIARNGAFCHGNNGCGQQLTEGEPLDVRPRWFAFCGAAVGVGIILAWAVVNVLFPPPLKDVDFAQHEIHVHEDGGVVSLQISRTAKVDRRETVLFNSSDGTALAGKNYEAANGEVVFDSGDKNKYVTITILRGNGYLKSDLYFQVTLTNVAGKPRQIVIIDEPKVDDTLKAQAERVVRAASVVANDIADDVVRERVLTRLLSASRSDQSMFERDQRVLQTVQGNLTRSRESYAQSFRDMHTIQPRAVMDAMDHVAQDENRNGFSQQSRATETMKRQYAEYLSNGNIDMDRWANELSSVIPSVPPGPASAL